MTRNNCRRSKYHRK